MEILITGGAGFIGKRLALALVDRGHSVTVYDNLNPQVHSAPDLAVSELRGAGVRFIEGDVRDGSSLRDHLLDMRSVTVVHLAAETGTGQSYDLPSHYCDVNVTGTAMLTEVLRTVHKAGTRVARVVLASSRAVYGEGGCLNSEGSHITARPRMSSDLHAGDFSPKDQAGNSVTPVPSSARETSVAPASIYASTKLMQEFILRQGLDQTGIECAILRLQNVYGVGQSLNNPYTGVLSIFAQQLLDGRTLDIYEDGKIVRDFVYVSDVVEAFVRVCEMERLTFDILDIGSGKPTTIAAVAEVMIIALGIGGNRIAVTGRFRPGDIRHAVADISAASDSLDWAPQVALVDGVTRLVDWARSGK